MAAIATTMLVLAPSAADAQAWTRQQGAGFAALSYRRIASDSLYTPDGEKRPLASTYTQHNVGLYGEVGLVDRWLTASVDSELFRYSALEGQGATYGLGDLRLSAFSGVLVAPFRLAVGLQLGVPTGDPTPDAPGGDPDSQAVARLLPTGDGEWDVSAKVVFGHSFGGTASYPLAHWLVADVGYWLRTRGFFDAISYRVELGTKIAREDWDRIALILRVFGLESFAGSNAGAGFAGLGDGVSYTAFGVDLMARVLGPAGLTVGFDGAFRGRNVPAAFALKLSIYTTFGP